MAPTPATTADGAATRRGTDSHSPPSNVDRDASRQSAAAASGDPAYGIPLIGPLLAQADRFRTQLPLGPAWNKSEAEVLRAEARALHAIAHYMEARARQLDRLKDGAEDKPRVRRVAVD